MTRRPDRDGMVLLNVLLIMAVASVAVLVMISAQDIEVQRSTRLREAAQAGAYARAGELSAITVLRRDAVEAPDTDNMSEAWAAVGQEDISVPGGRFALSIQDEQARFNINALVDGQSAPIALFQRIATVAGVQPESQIAIANVVRVAGPLTDLGLLRTAGVSPAELAALQVYVTALPIEATLNMNTVEMPLLSVVTGDQTIAENLMRQRSQVGFLVPTDLANAGMVSQPAIGFTSDHYRVTTTVSVGDTTQRLTSRVARIRQINAVDVVVTARRRSAG